MPKPVRSAMSVKGSGVLTRRLRAASTRRPRKIDSPSSGALLLCVLSRRWGIPSQDGWAGDVIDSEVKTTSLCCCCRNQGRGSVVVAACTLLCAVINLNSRENPKLFSVSFRSPRLGVAAGCVGVCSRRRAGSHGHGSRDDQFRQKLQPRPDGDAGMDLSQWRK